MSEAQAIMRYLCELHGVLDKWFGESLEERARISMLLSWHHHAVRKTVMLNYNLPTYYLPFYFGGAAAARPGKEKLEELRKNFAESLQQLEEFIGSEPFLVGGRLTAADIAIAPDLTAMDVDPDVNEILAAFPAVRKWLERLRETPGFIESHAGFANALPAMREHFVSQSATPGDFSFMDCWEDPWLEANEA